MSYSPTLSSLPPHYPSFTLHVAPPSVSVTPSEPVLSVADTLTLTCTGGDCVGNTIFTFSWLLDGRPVNTSLVTAVSNTSNTSQLSVTSVTSADFGTYTCQVTNVYGTGTAVSYVQEKGKLLCSLDEYTQLTMHDPCVHMSLGSCMVVL